MGDGIDQGPIAIKQQPPNYPALLFARTHLESTPDHLRTRGSAAWRNFVLEADDGNTTPTGAEHRRRCGRPRARGLGLQHCLGTGIRHFRTTQPAPALRDAMSAAESNKERIGRTWRLGLRVHGLGFRV